MRVENDLLPSYTIDIEFYLVVFNRHSIKSLAPSHRTVFGWHYHLNEAKKITRKNRKAKYIRVSQGAPFLMVHHIIQYIHTYIHSIHSFFQSNAMFINLCSNKTYANISEERIEKTNERINRCCVVTHINMNIVQCSFNTQNES